MKKILIPVLLLVTILTGCTTEYEIYINVDGTVTDVYKIEKDKSFILPDDPAKEGYTFNGWYTDEEFSVEYDNSRVVSNNLNLYAKFEAVTTILYLQYEDVILGGYYIEYNEYYDLPDVTFGGYTFDGWYTSDAYTEAATSVTGTLENQAFYAKLTKQDVNIPGESELDLNTLPYFSYLKDTNPVVTITVKDVGVMTLQLFPDIAPNTVNNFITYIQNDAYTGSTFHRIIEDFMIQGGIVETTTCSINGDFGSNGFTNNLSHSRGILSMARTSVNNSATSQFFIVDQESTFLDQEYAGFGGLVSGFNILDYLAGIATLSDDAPLETVEIESITVELNGYIVDTVVCAE